MAKKIIPKDEEEDKEPEVVIVEPGSEEGDVVIIGPEEEIDIQIYDSREFTRPPRLKNFYNKI